MPRDYDINAKAVSGLAPGRGSGKIAGEPEGLGMVKPNWRWGSSPLPGDGVIRGNPVGIKGEIRRATSEGMKGALARRLKR